MGQATSPALLKGQLVLLAEDEPLIAFDTEEMLRMVGADVLVAPDFDSAMLAASRSDVTVAVLDYRLGQQTIEPVCVRLDIRRLPYVIATGDGAMPIMGGKALLKPVEASLLIAALVEALAQQPPPTIANLKPVGPRP